MNPYTFLLFLLPAVSAQWGGGGGSGGSGASGGGSTTTASSSSAVQTVAVGANSWTYSPDTLSVKAGDKVEFNFYGTNHSVSEASFNNPCQPMSSTSFFSGFHVSPSVFTLTVNDTNPIWFYCGRPSHCQSGMVGVINPPTSGSQTLAAFKSAAAKTKNSTVLAQAQGGILSMEKSSTGTASGAPSGTATPSASASSTNTAEKLGFSKELSVMSGFTLLVAIFMM